MYTKKYLKYKKKYLTLRNIIFGSGKNFNKNWKISGDICKDIFEMEVLGEFIQSIPETFYFTDKELNFFQKKKLYYHLKKTLQKIIDIIKPKINSINKLKKNIDKISKEKLSIEKEKELKKKEKEKEILENLKNKIKDLLLKKEDITKLRDEILRIIKYISEKLLSKKVHDCTIKKIKNYFSTNKTTDEKINKKSYNDKGTSKKEADQFEKDITKYTKEALSGNENYEILSNINLDFKTEKYKSEIDTVVVKVEDNGKTVLALIEAKSSFGETFYGMKNFPTNDMLEGEWILKENNFKRPNKNNKEPVYKFSENLIRIAIANKDVHDDNVMIDKVKHDIKILSEYLEKNNFDVSKLRFSEYDFVIFFEKPEWYDWFDEKNFFVKNHTKDNTPKENTKDNTTKENTTDNKTDHDPIELIRRKFLEEGFKNKKYILGKIQENGTKLGITYNIKDLIKYVISMNITSGKIKSYINENRKEITSFIDENRNEITSFIDEKIKV